MKAQVGITVHGVTSLDAVQLRDLTQDLAITFSRTPLPDLANDALEVRTETSSTAHLFRTIEGLVVQLATRYGSDLWVSVEIDWRSKS